MKRFSLILLCFALFLSGCGKKKASENKAGASAVPTIQVARMDLSSSIEEEGEIDSVKTVEVKSRISGRITRIFVNEGDIVPQGKALLQIEADSEQNRVISSAVTEMKEALIAYQAALRDYNNQKELLERGFISKDEFQTSQDDYTKADLRYQTAKSQYELIRKESGMSEGSASRALSVSAPMSGMVVSNAVEEGELVSGESTARSGSLLFTIADHKSLMVKVSINEYDVERVRLGQKVEIRRSQNTSERYVGTVYRIAPVAIEKDGVKVYPVEIRIENPGEGLRFGMSVIVKINIASKKAALCIPVSALFIDQDKRDFVLLKKNGSAERVYVKRGVYNEAFVEISSGVSEGDEIYTQRSAESGRNGRNGSRGGPGGPMGPRM